MDQPNKTSAEKTSTGLPIDQSYTPPSGNSTRPTRVVPPARKVFQSVFPDLEDSKRPASDTIGRDISYVFSVLQDVGNLPKFFENLEKVERVNESQSKWTLKGADQKAIPVTIESTMTGNLVVWKSTDVVGLPYTIAVHLEKAQADRGTVARIMTSYDSKAAEVVGLFEKLMGKDAATMGKKTLQRLKAFCETGHVPTIEGQPSGRDSDSKILSGESVKSELKH